MADLDKTRVLKSPNDTPSFLPKPDEMQICSDEYERFLFYVTNSHLYYVDRVNNNFRYFLGSGGQWTDTDRDYYENTLRRKTVEDNHILPAIQTATGEQIFTRADTTFKPRKGQASEEVAKILSKLVLNIQVDNGYHRKEKTVWKDGLIKQRGYFDIRMDFDANLNGNVNIRTLNPISVMPDIYAESYDPKEWKEVTTFYWLSFDEIEGMYGKEARDRAEMTHGWYSDTPFSEEFTSRNIIDRRYGFGLGGISMLYEKSEAGEKRLRIIERQYYKWDTVLCYVDPATGDSLPVKADTSESEAQKIAAERGHVVVKQRVKLVYWRASTRFTLLHDSRSPYRSFTVIPFFYIFDYGTTLGMVDNAISMQDLRNKALSNGLHILSSTANSGFMVERGSLTNMSTEDLEERGAQTGLVVEYDEGKTPPVKIQPNQFPEGLRFLMETGKQGVKDSTGIQDADAMLRSHTPGDSVQSGMFQQKLQLADPLDNLEHTRRLVTLKCLELVQDFYTSERIIKISDTDEYGKEVSEQLKINEVTATGDIINDITLGEYDVAVATKPTAVTWMQTQFNEAIRMKEVGVRIPDDELVRRSNLDNKHELADKMGQPVDDGGEAKAQAELTQAKTKKTLADAEASDAKAITSKIQGIYGAVNAAQILATTPQSAPLADELLLSSGFSDAQIPEPIAAPQEPVQTDVPQNKHPNFPPSATQGVDTGATLR